MSAALLERCQEVRFEDGTVAAWTVDLTEELDEIDAGWQQKLSSTPGLEVEQVRRADHISCRESDREKLFRYTKLDGDEIIDHFPRGYEIYKLVGSFMLAANKIVHPRRGIEVLERKDMAHGLELSRQFPSSDQWGGSSNAQELHHDIRPNSLLSISNTAPFGDGRLRICRILAEDFEYFKVEADISARGKSSMDRSRLRRGQSTGVDDGQVGSLSNIEQIFVTHKAGQLTIFPQGEIWVHGTEPISAGIRDVLVCNYPFTDMPQGQHEELLKHNTGA